MDTVVYRGGNRYSEKKFKNESDLEKLVVDNSKMLFGKSSIYIDAKKKIDNSALGGVIPDGFLLDISDKNSPEFYIVEVELAKHNFFNHIFPQITKFFAFFKNPDNQGKLIEKLYDIFKNDNDLMRELTSKVGSIEIYKFLKDVIENSQNILMIIDDEKVELPEIIETYTDTWGKMVKVAILKEYRSNQNQDDVIFTMSPDFLNIENIDLVSSDLNVANKPATYTEAYHLDGIEEKTKRIYEILKKEIISRIPSVYFNPQRYYISLRKKRNFAFFKIRRKKIGLVVMAPVQKVKELIKHHNVFALSEPIQRFYNGPCAKIDIISDEHLEEIINLLVEIQK
jgi:predicted transport protein